VLVSVAFTPILLTVSQAPAFSSTRSMSFGRLFRVSPLGCVGIFLMGGVYAAIFGMGAVWGGLRGLSVLEISIFVAAIYMGGLLFQYPIGWLSDRIDRRQLIVVVALACAAAALAAAVVPMPFTGLAVVALVIGGLANPLYALLLAHTNDFLKADDMAGASGGLLFINGVGAVAGPLVIGALMDGIGPEGFFLFIAGLCVLLGLYALWRMTRRTAPTVAEQGAYAPLTPSASVVTLDAAFEPRNPDATEPAHAPDPR
jgi:MFS family permease